MYLVSMEMRHWLEMDYRLLIAQSYRGYIHQLSIYITHAIQPLRKVANNPEISAKQ